MTVGRRSPARVAVIGGGITGVAAAHELARIDPDCDVVLIEASGMIGGKIRTSPFAGLPAVDEAADAFLARLPWAIELARHVGLGESLDSPAVQRASIWHDGLHDLPAGLLLGMPTDVVAMARSRLLSWPAKLRAATEVVRPRTATDADSLGGYVRARFGDEVHERLVDPLVGSIYAADTDRFSLAAVPQIAELASSSRSVLAAARRRPPAPPGAVFAAPSGGMIDLVTRTADAAAITVRLGTPVTELAPDGARWIVNGEGFDSIVLACPAAAAAALIGSFDVSTAAALATIPTADVVLITATVATGPWSATMRGRSGYLVPKAVQGLVTAVSFASEKWPRWSLPDRHVLRISLGRDGLPVLHHDDDALVRVAAMECSQHLGHELGFETVRVSRWPAAFAQYRPHHHRLVEQIEQALPAGLAIAGASFHGIGIPACIRSGQRAAQRSLRPDG